MHGYRLVVLGATDSAYLFWGASLRQILRYYGKYLSKRGGKYDEDSDDENNHSYDCKYIDKILC